jgi:Tfp pilus assembly major pilin PilA
VTHHENNIVIGMAGLVMTITIPFVQRTIHRDAVYQAVHLVEDACRNARAAAIFQNATTELIIHPQDKAFSVRPGRAPAPVRRAAVGQDDSAPAPAAGSAFQATVKPFSGRLGDDVSIEMLDVNFIELKHEEEARVRFHPNGTSDEFTVVMRIGGNAWRKITLDLVTGLPTLEIIR